MKLIQIIKCLFGFHRHYLLDIEFFWDISYGYRVPDLKYNLYCPCCRSVKKITHYGEFVSMKSAEEYEKIVKQSYPKYKGD